MNEKAPLFVELNTIVTNPEKMKLYFPYRVKYKNQTYIFVKVVGGAVHLYVEASPKTDEITGIDENLRDLWLP